MLVLVSNSSFIQVIFRAQTHKNDGSITKFDVQRSCFYTYLQQHIVIVKCLLCYTDLDTLLIFLR